MSEEITLSLVERTVLGKTVKHLRREGMTPAVVHDHGKESRVVMAPSTDIWKAYRQAGKHHPVSLTVGKHKYMAIIKDVDFEPTKQQIRHIVFNAIKQDEKVETEVPVHLSGDAPAVKVGLLVVHMLDHVEIEALPRDLIDSLEVDVTGLSEVGDRVFVKDIVAPKGVTILTEPEHPIAAVEETKAQMSEEAAEEAAATDVPSAHGAAQAADEEE